MWGELASHKRLFNPPPQFSRLGTQCPALMSCHVYLCMCVVLGFVNYGGGGFLYLSMAGVLCTIISWYTHNCMGTWQHCELLNTVYCSVTHATQCKCSPYKHFPLILSTVSLTIVSVTIEFAVEQQCCV